MVTSLDLLKERGLRITGSRQEILDCFIEKSSAIAQADIEAELNSDMDRVTIYRTLKSFVDKGLIHKILDDSGVVKYALCKETCQDGVHRHDHLHFKCVICQETVCMEKNLLPDFCLPKGYVASEVSILVQGICPNCKNTSDVSN